MRDALVTHPGIAAATMVDPPRTEVAMRLLENMLGLLLAGGLDPQDAAWAADILAAQVTYAAIEAELRRTDPSALVEEVAANFARLPADRFPLITAHAATTRRRRRRRTVPLRHRRRDRRCAGKGRTRVARRRYGLWGASLFRDQGCQALLRCR